MSHRFRLIKEQIIGRLERELDPRLLYHNVGHTLDVLQQAEILASEEGITSEKDLELLKTACVFHDSGFLFTYRNHEEVSCDVARKELPPLFDDREIDAICGMIMATRIPQTPLNHLEQIICDADLDYLGRDDFGPISDNLYKEFRTFGILSDTVIWDHFQIKFFNLHKYFTKSCLAKRNEKKLMHLQMLKDRSHWKDDK